MQKNVLAFPSLSPAKDTRGHPAFRSIVMRWLWRFYTWRLTQAGRWFLWPTLGFFAYTSASLEFQSFVPLCYVAGVWLVAFALTLLYRPGVKLNIHHADRVCAGESMPVDVDVSYTAWAPGELFLVPHRLPQEVDAEPADGALVPEADDRGRTRVRLALRCQKRGVYMLQGMRVETDFPFGLLRNYTVHKQDRSLLVYPRFLPLTRLALPMGRRYQPGGVALLSIIGDSVEYVGNREFREGDNLRDVDWRATARLDRMIVREYREEYLLRVAVVLDTMVPHAGTMRAADADLENFERAVSLCAAVGDYLARQEYVVDIFAAGPNLYHLTAGRSLAYLDQILDILACIKENPAEPFERIEPELFENLARISTIVCVFMEWNDARRDFCDRLRQQGVAVKVIIVCDKKCAEDPVIDGPGFGGIPVLNKETFERGVQEL